MQLNALKGLLPGLAFVAVAVVIAKPADAASIVYYNDFVLGTDAMAGALAGSGHTVTTATSTSQFETLVQGGAFELGIFFVQNNNASSYTSAINALGNFVAGGGRSMYADWSQNASLASLFDAGFTGGLNQNQVTFTDPLYGSGTINLTNPGWGTYSTGLTPVSAAAANFGNGDGAIVVGKGGRSITYGFLNDTFANPSQGSAMYKSHIDLILGGSPTQVPTPALLPGLIGLGVAALRKRKAEAAEQANEV